jgi:hypothetical protein
LKGKWNARKGRVDLTSERESKQQHCVERVEAVKNNVQQGRREEGRNQRANECGRRGSESMSRTA